MGWDLGFPNRAPDPVKIGEFVDLSLNRSLVFQKENFARANGLGHLDRHLGGNQHREKEYGVHSGFPHNLCELGVNTKGPSFITNPPDCVFVRGEGKVAEKGKRFFWP